MFGSIAFDGESGASGAGAAFGGEPIGSSWLRGLRGTDGAGSGASVPGRWDAGCGKSGGSGALPEAWTGRSIRFDTPCNTRLTRGPGPSVADHYLVETLLHAHVTGSSASDACGWVGRSVARAGARSFTRGRH